MVPGSYFFWDSGKYGDLRSLIHQVSRYWVLTPRNGKSLGFHRRGQNLVYFQELYRTLAMGEDQKKRPQQMLGYKAGDKILVGNGNEKRGEIMQIAWLFLRRTWFMSSQSVPAAFGDWDKQIGWCMKAVFLHDLQGVETDWKVRLEHIVKSKLWIRGETGIRGEDREWNTY